MLFCINNVIDLLVNMYHAKPRLATLKGGDIMGKIVMILIGGLLGLLALCLERGMKSVKKKTQIKVDIHNRAVRLGLYSSGESVDTKEECFVSDSFLRLHNGGTADVAYLKDCEYRKLIPFEKTDLYLE